MLNGLHYHLGFFVLVTSECQSSGDQKKDRDYLQFIHKHALMHFVTTVTMEIFWL